MRTKEKFPMARDGVRMDLSNKHSDSGYKIKGEVRWKLEDTTTGEITEGKMNNIVTLDASILIARLMKGTLIPYTSEVRFGVYALAVGTGSVFWSPLDPPPPTLTQRSLENEIARKQIASSTFIDANGNPSAIPTHIVDFTTTFSEAEGVGVLDELGLIGSDCNSNVAIINSIVPPNGPYDPTVDVTGKDGLISYLTYSAITKPATSTLTFTYRLTF